MATLELKSVTIRLPSDLLELIGARVSDRDTRTDVIINLLRQALDQPVSNADSGISAVEQKVSEVSQRVDDLVESLNNVRQQITLLDVKPNNDRDEWITKQIELLESRLSIVEKSKSTIESHTQKQLELIETDSIKTDKLPLINPIEVIEVKPDLPIKQIEEKPLEIAETTTKLVLQPHNRGGLGKRFGLDPSTIGKRKTSGKFTKEWSKSQDPDGIAWEYHEDDNLYHPFIEAESRP